MKRGEFRYLKRTKYVQFLDIDGKQIHTAPLNQFRMVLDIIKEDPDEPEFKYFFYLNGEEVEVDGVTYMEAETFFTQGE